MIMDMSDPAITSSGFSDEELIQQTLNSLAASMGSELTSEPMDVNGQAGKYFFVAGLLSMSGYITILDSRVISIVVVNPSDEEAALRETLNGILGIAAE